MKNRKLFTSIAVIAILTLIVITGCKKKEEEPEKGTIKISMGDSRVPHTTKSVNDSITNPADLTKCQITISSISIKSTDGNYVDVLTSPKNIDLRQFQGSVSDLLNTEVPVGSYTAVRVIVSGVSTTYQGNNYTAVVGTTPSLTIASPSMTINQGVPNVFTGGPVTSEIPLSFTVGSSSDIESIRLSFDTDASTYIVSFTYLTYTWNFAGIRNNILIGIILEQGIQQIRHSPPYGITIFGVDNVSYYGIHTFVDFNQKGGNINSHTSQHVFRGEDGSLLVDAEPMETNTNLLSPNTIIAATGETDLRSDETFKYSTILANLAGLGYTLQSGKTYYFSLRKTWNITTNGQTYNLTRICEPIPVTMP